MKQFIVKKFKCRTLTLITSTVIVAETADEARNIGEKTLECGPGEFVGAQNK